MAATTINETQFRRMRTEGKPLLVDYWAPWCTYCRRIAPAYDRIAEQFAAELTVAKVNIDDEPLLARQEAIEVIPTLVLYRDGKALGSLVAPDSGAKIEDFIRQTLSAT